MGNNEDGRSDAIVLYYVRERACAHGQPNCGYRFGKFHLALRYRRQVIASAGRPVGSFSVALRNSVWRYVTGLVSEEHVS
jgi:hypothetical protein